MFLRQNCAILHTLYIRRFEKHQGVTKLYFSILSIPVIIYYQTNYNL